MTLYEIIASTTATTQFLGTLCILHKMRGSALSAHAAFCHCERINLISPSL